jgi:crotonobetainyl-CoA:carnitine CoA-transferase CaiB-like acyl-CoA transferase
MRFSSVKRPTDPSWWEWSPYFQALNVDKKSLTLDLASSEGQALLCELIPSADVVIENFSPRVLDSFGLSWEKIHALNPAAILVRMPAFGLTGPWRDRVGFAQTMEQISGLAWITGYPDDRPVIPRGVCDPLAGIHAVVALLTTLASRDRTGVGRMVEVPMIEAALNVAAEVVIEHTAYGASLTRDGNRGPVAAPQGVYACLGKERWLALAVRSDHEWRTLSDVLSDPTWMQDPVFENDTGRRLARDELDERLATEFLNKDRDELVTALLRAGIPAAPVVSPVAVLQHPHLRDRGFIERIEHPILGVHEAPGLPFRFSKRSDPWFQCHAPTLGEHNSMILCGQLGIDVDEFRRLCEARVIGDRPA